MVKMLIKCNQMPRFLKWFVKIVSVMTSLAPVIGCKVNVNVENTRERKAKTNSFGFATDPHGKNEFVFGFFVSYNNSKVL